MPKRIRLSRAKGWRMPNNTVKVDRSTPWGNPFVVGQDGTAEDCVRLHRILLSGHVCITAKASVERQLKHMRFVTEHIGELRSKDIACWCREGCPCHGDTYLDLANAPEAE
ncbi:DUF4326 domain-containing protein [Inquilinus sp.]|uniref:DUF4326 domain-containing protein n=1 Tax=Inquilinus sp. TaxID=1932117 RepID=UPI0031DA7A4E